MGVLLGLLLAAAATNGLELIPFTKKDSVVQILSEEDTFVPSERQPEPGVQVKFPVKLCGSRGLSL